MRFSLGFSGRNLAQTLSRWGAELRNTFVLGDEDFEWLDWEIPLSSIGTVSPGVTFSNLNVELAKYLHIGTVVFWKVVLHVQASADFMYLEFAPPPPTVYENCIIGSGVGAVLNTSAYPGSNLYAYGFVHAPVDAFRFVPCPAPAMVFYTAGGTLISSVFVYGFYITDKHPGR